MKDKVNVYVKSTASDTMEITDFLRKRGISYDLFDISSNVAAHKRMLEATRGAGGPPVIEVGHQVVLGFDADRLEETIQYEFR
jgi:hypothetical protein